MNPQDYRRNLPHLLSPGETVFVTFRLAGSLPEAVVEQLRAEFSSETANEEATYVRQKRYFGRFDALLDGSVSGPTWLQQPMIGRLVADALHFFDGRAYTLICYCIMPNHVHLVAVLLEAEVSMMRALQSVKAHTAREANRLLGRTGQFWHRESYDHVVRSASEMQNVIAYALENPVRAGLTDSWQQWPCSYWAG
ncbi:transposase [Hymenobacter algoricola]|uniref:Transposase n=1 Tax=Hymenobacter algoricola TaxID=486267 RepID=A0ABP7N1R0_9BACT